MTNFEQSSQYIKDLGIFANRDAQAVKRMNQRMEKAKFNIFKFLFGKQNDVVPVNGLPVLKPNLAEFLEPSDQMKLIWFGHSTFMLNVEAKIVLVDPVLSSAASPIPLVIRRFQAPPLQASELPDIDFILISHDHYDHLDMSTIKHFKGKNTRFLVPLGVGSHLTGWGIDSDRVTEHDWWQSTTVDGIEFTATPAQHFSGRSFYDKNATLWAGWAVKATTQSLFFSGDSGYDIHFGQIGERLGPFDIVLLDNGQYNPAWEEVHMLPEQASQAVRDLKAKAFFPVHWGGFKLSTHPWYEPIQRAYQLSTESPYRIVAPKIGEVLSVSDNYQTDTWWTALIGDKG